MTSATAPAADAAATPPRPNTKPDNPNFSAGPTTKRPGWSFDALRDAALGRSHRSGHAKAKLKEVIDRSRAILGIPDTYYVGIIGGSDTGAVEAAMWGLLGPRGVDVLAWENFGNDWVVDATKQLDLADLRTDVADYGKLPDLSLVKPDRDVVFTWNGTTSGVCIANGDWIADDRTGLTICDATSAAYAFDLPWPKLDVTTWSWQKVMGGEAQHGMIVLSPRAVERLESHTPSWPVPKMFRLTKGGKLNEGIFKGETINTPSMLAVEDHLDGLKWAERIGGLPALIARSKANYQVVADWVAKTDWAAFLSEDPTLHSTTSLCIKIVDPWFQGLDAETQAATAKKIVTMLDKEGIAYDIGSYRTAPPGLRLWGGSTVEADDLAKLLPWIDWAWAQIKPAG